MELETLIRHYFGTDDPTDVPPDVFERGVQALAIDFGTERDPGRRFALWALMHMLGVAPTPEDAFEDEADRRAARRFADLSGRLDAPDA